MDSLISGIYDYQPLKPQEAFFFNTVINNLMKQYDFKELINGNIWLIYILIYYINLLICSIILFFYSELKHESQDLQSQQNFNRGKCRDQNDTISTSFGSRI